VLRQAQHERTRPRFTRSFPTALAALTGARARPSRVARLRFGRPSPPTIAADRATAPLIRAPAAPIPIIAGGRDALTPVRDREHVYRRIGSADKVFRRIGRQQGDAHDYSHADLILGLHTPDDVYPVIVHWLEAHRQPNDRRRTARATPLRSVGRLPGRANSGGGGHQPR
jgi:hypothetical protein